MFRVLEKSSSLAGWFFSNTNDLRSSRTRRLRVSSGPLEEFTDVNSFLRSKPRPTIRDEQQAKSSGKGLDGSLLPERLFHEGFSRGTRWAQPKAERMPVVHHERYSSINFARNLCSIQKQHISVSLTLSLNIKPAEEGWPYGNSVKACFQTEWPEGRLHKWAPAHSLAAQIY
mgnify:CR=1 FL=1